MASSLVPLLAERDELYEALHESGMIATDELLMARIERAFNEYVVASGSERLRAAGAIETAARELERVLQRKVDAGLLADREARATNGAVAALRASLRWYDSAMVRSAGAGGPPSETAPGTTSIREGPRKDRTALTTTLREKRREGLRQEAEILGRLLASSLAGDTKKSEFVAAQIRQLIVKAQLGEIEFATTKQQAGDLVAAAQSAVEPRQYEDLRALVEQLDWYGGAVLRKLYGP